MNLVKKVLGSVLAISLMASVVAGCGDSKQGTTSQSTTQQTTQATTQKEPLVTLKWHIRNSQPANFSSVMGKVNEYLEEKHNLKLDLVCVEPAQWGEKLPLMFAAQENMDLVWAATWGGYNFLEGISKNAFLPLDDLLASKGKAIVDSMPQFVWDGVKYVDGKIYGVPNYQIMAAQDGLIIKKDLVEKYDIKLDEFKTKEGLLKWLQLLKDKEPGMYPVAQAKTISQFAFIENRQANNIVYYSGLEWVNTKTWDVIDYTDEDFKYQMEEWDLNREFFKRGFLNPDVATIKDFNAEFKTGKYAMLYSRYKPGGDIESSAKFGFDVVSFPVGTPVITRGSILSTLTAISKFSDNPERAMDLINLVNTDTELYNMLVYGIEGQDYKKVGTNRIEKIADTFNLPAYMLGNQFNAYLLPGQPDDIWESTKKLNEAAKPEELMGFTFDSANVQVEGTNLKSIDDQYGPILDNGLMDVEKTLNDLKNKKLKAGYEKMQAERQSQLTKWVTENKK